MKVHGKCHCGNIAYEAVVTPESVTICHCADCQMLTGSVYRVIAHATKENFWLKAGQPKTYIKTADSGNKRAHTFCPDCGTPVYSTDPTNPLKYSVRVGCLDERAMLRPVKQQWCQSRLPWASNLEGIPQLDRQ
jgi:hypothetical protein